MGSTMAVFSDAATLVAGIFFGSVATFVEVALYTDAFAHWALTGKVAAWFGFEVAIVDFHVDNLHELDLCGQFLYFLLKVNL